MFLSILKSYRERARRRELILFFELILLLLSVGCELSRAWGVALSWLPLERCLKDRVMPSALDPSGLQSKLCELAKQPPVRATGPWFQLLLRLYQSGATLTPVVTALSEQLRQAEARDRRHFLQALSGRLNLLLILFFLPPTLVLVLGPILYELARIF